MKTSKILWGLLIVGCGILLLLYAFGIGEEYDAFRIIGSALLLGIAITNVAQLHFFLFTIPLSLIVYLWRTTLGLPEDTNVWLLLGAAALLGIGLETIFHKKQPCQVKVRHDGEEWKDVTDWKESSEVLTDNEFVNIESSFGEHTKYIHASNLKRVNIASNFSSVKIYFDQCQISSEGLRINVSSNFSGVVLSVPRDWSIVNHITTFAGSVSDQVSPAAGEKRVELQGSVNFAEVKIIRV